MFVFLATLGLATPSYTIATKPAVSLEPIDVLASQMSAFADGKRDTLETVWAFVDEDGPLAAAHRSSAGARARFVQVCHREPRWQHIGGRPLAALPRVYKWEVLSRLERSEYCTLIRVRAKPFFPDAPTADAEVVFVWTFVKMHDSTGMNRNGDLEDCWLVHDIEPDWGGWTVFV